MRKIQEVPAGVVPASETLPAGGSSPAPGSLTLSSGLTLPPTWRPLKALPGAFAAPFADYLSYPAPGRSNLDKIRVSPLHFRHCLKHPAPSSRAQTRGRVAHRLWFEPKQFWLETVVWKGGSKTTGTGAVTRWKAFQEEHAGKDIINEQDEQLFLELEELFRNHPQTKGLLAGASLEASMLFERDGVLCKMRADIVRPADGTIDDLKTTYDLAEFAKTIEKYGAHRQGDFYLDGATTATGVEFKKFRLVAVQLPPEDKPLAAPVDIAVFELGADLLNDGREENDANLATYKRCTANNTWPGFAPVAPLVIGRPPWRNRS